jgi:hypothetical protein
VANYPLFSIHIISTVLYQAPWIIENIVWASKVQIQYVSYLSSSGRDKSWGQLKMVKLRRAKRCSKPSGKEPRLGQYIIVKCSREVRCS